MARTVFAFALLLLLAVPARADNDDALESTGFSTYGTGELSGRVTDLDDKPLAKVEVHIAFDRGTEQLATTDKAGRFRATLRGHARALVYVRAKVKIVAQISVPSPDAPNGEIVEIHESLPPAVMAAPLSKRLEVPPYSSQSIQKNAWVRAHVLLDVDTAGHVSRLKLLDAPGYDLNLIAIRKAFQLAFTPARDRTGKAMPSLVVWTFEWPAFWWAKKHEFIPPEVQLVPCKGSGPSNAVVRDCSTPSMGRAVNLPWIDPQAANAAASPSR